MANLFDILFDLTLSKIIPNPLPQEFLIFELILYSILLIFCFVIIRKLVKSWRRVEELQSVFFPIIILVSSLVFLSVLLFVNSAFMLYSENNFRLHINLRVIIPFYGTIIGSKLLISRLIKVSRSRKKRIRIVHKLINIQIFLYSFTIILLYIPAFNQSLLILIFLSLFINLINILIFLLISYILQGEQKVNTSLIMKMRIVMIRNGFLGMLGTLIITILITGLIANPSGSFFNLAYILRTIFVLIIGFIVLSFYWAYFLPGWLKKRKNLNYDISQNL